MGSPEDFGCGMEDEGAEYRKTSGVGKTNIVQLDDGIRLRQPEGQLGCSII